MEFLDLENTGLSSFTDVTGINASALETLILNNNTLSELDLSSFNQLEGVFCNNCNLSTFNIANGNNAAITQLDVTNNSGLSCITVDDPNTIPAGWNKDATAMYALSCETAIPDTNFETALRNLGLDGTGPTNDGVVQTALIAANTSLDVSGQNIADLTGIEAFTSLTSLIVSQNAFTALDLSGISNTVTSIIAQGMPNLTSVSFGANSAIELMSFGGCGLTSIDLSTFSALKSLGLDNNPISTVDLSGNAVELLTLSGTQISALSDIVGLPVGIRRLQLNGLSFNTQLDFSPFFNLTELRLNNNGLLGLNIANGTNPQLTILDV